MALATPAPRVLADLVPQTAVRQAVLVLGAAAFVGVAAQVIIPLPFTPVPLSLSTFAVLLSAAALGTVRGVLAMSIYAVAGMVGVPWFASGTSGIQTPTLGYIIGYILAAAIVGKLAETGATKSMWRTAGIMILGTTIIYLIGFTWLKFAIDVSWAQALTLGVAPFLIGDAIKVLAAAALFPAVWAAVRAFTNR